MKSIPTQGASTRDLRKGQNEVNILKRCNSRNIVRYYEDFFENNCIEIIMEYCPNGDLYNVIRNQKNSRQFFPTAEVYDWCKQLAQGLQYMKSVKIFHR